LVAHASGAGRTIAGPGAANKGTQREQAAGSFLSFRSWSRARVERPCLTSRKAAKAANGGSLSGQHFRRKLKIGPICQPTAKNSLSYHFLDWNDSEERVVIAIGDSAMEEAVSLPLGVLRASIRDFLELPQHLYVLPEDASWCLSFTMEGDLAFGHAPKP
jgi:hypothetical protein